ncbi:MAG: hypothetical protein AAF399_12985 [Bacteroidota bacterium]
MTTQEIKDLIQKGKLEKAIEQLVELTKDSDYEDDVLLLSSRYHGFKEAKRSGTSSRGDLTVSLNTLSRDALSLIAELAACRIMAINIGGICLP